MVMSQCLLKGACNSVSVTIKKPCWLIMMPLDGRKVTWVYQYTKLQATIRWMAQGTKGA